MDSLITYIQFNNIDSLFEHMMKGLDAENLYVQGRRFFFFAITKKEDVRVHIY